MKEKTEEAEEKSVTVEVLPRGTWTSLSEAIPSMGRLIRFITSEISGGACCQVELSAWPVIRASNEDRASQRPGTAQMTPRPGGVQGQYF